jgi:hypothetical protein
MGMIEWLNHRNGAISNPRAAFFIAGLLLIIGAIVSTRCFAGRWLIMVAAGMCAFAVTASVVRATHSAQMPGPPRKSGAGGEMIRVGIDRGVSDAILSKGGFIGGKVEGFGIFERWILRLGWFTHRGSGPELFEGNGLVVFFTPTKPVSEELRRQVREYVKNGGHVLVIDTPENGKSTANGVLKPFGMELLKPYTPIEGEAVSDIGLPTIPVGPSLEAAGGSEVIARVGGRAVAARSQYGKGSVTALGFGAKFNDSNYGVTGDIVPDEALRKVYDVQYGILRHILGQPLPATRPTTSPK